MDEGNAKVLTTATTTLPACVKCVQKLYSKNSLHRQVYQSDRQK